jgi:hypothetical protein
MKTREQIIARINALTAGIGGQIDHVYDLALENKERGVIWELHNADKKIQRLYSELLTLQWVLEEGET